MSSEIQPEATLASEPSPLRRLLGPEDMVLVALVALSIVGIAVTDFSRQYGLWYWLAMVPVFGAASIYAGWSRARGQGQTRVVIVRTQVLHWGSLALAISLIYWLETAGRVTHEDAGLIALIAVALTTFLAGVHFEWRMLVLGLVLGVAAAVAVLVQEFLWILLLPTALLGLAVLVWRNRSAATRSPSSQLAAAKDSPSV